VTRRTSDHKRFSLISSQIAVAHILIVVYQKRVESVVKPGVVKIIIYKSCKQILLKQMQVMFIELMTLDFKDIICSN